VRLCGTDTCLSAARLALGGSCVGDLFASPSYKQTEGAEAEKR
jgi:hypothetical protein